MKKRTVSQRNFVGALLGGILGILAFGYLHPIALPPGCFFGVIVGWWYQEIWQSTVKEFYQGIVKSRELWNRLMILALIPTKKFKKVKFNIGPCIKIFHSFLFPTVWVLKRPTACIRWLKAHPMNRAYAMKALAVITHIALNAIWIAPLVIYGLKDIETADKESMTPLFHLLGVGIIVPIVIVVPYMLFFERNESKIKRFYLDWGCYAARGPFIFFAKDLLYLFKLEISSLLSGIFRISWIVGIGGMFVLCVIVPISAVIGAIKGIYRVSTKPGHWLCSGVTITVTTLSAWFAYPYFNDARVLWAVALFAGIVSAIATEAMRYCLVWFFDASEKMQAIIIMPLHKRLAPIGQKFWCITNTTDNKFLSVLPASIF